ncbi:hypothetical protein B6A27_14585 [Anoxybacillus sp. UARK-01]|uniref:DUF4395 domain-containing protein n=1 Tax=Anoxybacteroides rupiense TaxID=311460 RepID=UPI0009B971F2|nr:DUF4395 domain-containing protein [Anoxybacillus rupiensis]OQM45234.1 hypothetical protein B6A27_14585 [Anoxybacillus sp. UARK-01]
MRRPKTPSSVPRPFVRVNQWFIVFSVLFTSMTYQEWSLLFPLISSLLGLFFHFHLVMRAAKFFLRKEPSEYIPEDDAQQSFNQIIAVICLSIGYVSFLAGWTKIAYVFTLLVALAAFAAILGFCIGCFIVKKIQAKLDCLNKGESYINIHVKEVLAYIIRNVHHTWELLVFERQNIPAAGIQILGGTFESCDRD